MPDDLTKRGPVDRTRIHTGQAHEVLYWRKRMGVTKIALILAAQEVVKEGYPPTVKRVKAKLIKRIRVA